MLFSSLIMQNKKLWYKFEKIAKEFLEKQNYNILKTNFTIRWWEIDIIAEKNGIVSFVEVKWVSSNTDFQNYITASKIKALQKTAEHWIYQNDNDNVKEYRFDLILIENWKIIDFIEGFLN